jgi:hypothetical protein
VNLAKKEEGLLGPPLLVLSGLFVMTHGYAMDYGCCAVIFFVVLLVAPIINVYFSSHWTSFHRGSQYNPCESYDVDKKEEAVLGSLLFDLTSITQLLLSVASVIRNLVLDLVGCFSSNDNRGNDNRECTNKLVRVHNSSFV